MDFNLPPINPFYVRGVKVEQTAMLGTYIFTNSSGQRHLIAKYLQHEGFFDKDKQFELAEN